MMRLFFDIGNTRLKWGVECDGNFVATGSIVNTQLGNAELDFIEPGFIELQNVLQQSDEIASVWASNVGPKKNEKIIEGWIKLHLGLSIDWVRVTRSFCQIKNTYADLNMLGVDRWMVVLGANQYRVDQGVQACAIIIVDAGTAINVELLSIDRMYLGGAILPGLKLMHDSLVGNTQGITSTLTDSVKLVGQSTQECVNSGVYHGVVGAVERVVERMIESPTLANSDILLLVTGGDAELVRENSRLNFTVVPQLVLKGVMCIADEGRCV